MSLQDQADAEAASIEADETLTDEERRQALAELGEELYDLEHHW